MCSRSGRDGLLPSIVSARVHAVEPIAHDRLAGISAFIATVEAGSFAQAAERLRLTRSAVGKAVARLEARLRVPLFVRTTRSLKLTHEGQRFYEGCAQALQRIDAVQEQLEAERLEAVGHLRISAPVVLGRRYVTPLLLDLAERYPRLKILGNFTDRLVDFAADGIDMAIRSGDLPNTDTLVARLLGLQAMVVCAAPAYLKDRGIPTDVSDLGSHRCLLYENDGHVVPWTLKTVNGTVVRPRLERHMGIDDGEAIAMAAVRGAGLAHLPLWLIRDELAKGVLVRVFPASSTVTIPMHLVWPRTPHLPHKLRILIDALMQTIPPLLAAE